MAQEIITLECTEAKALGKPASRYMTTRNKKSPRTGEKEIQSFFAATHVAPRNQVAINAAKNAKAPFRVSSRQSTNATASDRYCARSNRLQKS